MSKIADTVGIYLLYGIVWVYSCVESLCQRRTPVYSSMWEAVSFKDQSLNNDATNYHDLDRTDCDVVIHYIKKNHGLHTFYQTVVHGGDMRNYTVEDAFDSPPAPWFFIGYIDGDETIDCTDSLSHLVVSGNLVTVPLLYYLDPHSAGKQWVYINPKTFNQMDFPSEGILIGNVASAKVD